MGQIGEELGSSHCGLEWKLVAGFWKSDRKCLLTLRPTLVLAPPEDYAEQKCAGQRGTGKNVYSNFRARIGKPIKSLPIAEQAEASLSMPTQ